MLHKFWLYAKHYQWQILEALETTFWPRNMILWGKGEADRVATDYIDL